MRASFSSGPQCPHLSRVASSFSKRNASSLPFCVWAALVCARWIKPFLQLQPGRVHAADEGSGGNERGCR